MLESWKTAVRWSRWDRAGRSGGWTESSGCYGDGQAYRRSQTGIFLDTMMMFADNTVRHCPDSSWMNVWRGQEWRLDQTGVLYTCPVTEVFM